jgi:hypothetical protein
MLRADALLDHKELRSGGMRFVLKNRLTGKVLDQFEFHTSFSVDA